MTVSISHFQGQNSLDLFRTLSLHHTHLFVFASKTDWLRFVKKDEKWICTHFVDGQPVERIRINALQSFLSKCEKGQECVKYVVNAKMIQSGNDKVFKPFKPFKPAQP